MSSTGKHLKKNPRRTHRLVWILAATVLALALIAGGIIYFWQKNKKAEPIPDEEPPAEEPAELPPEEEEPEKEEPPKEEEPPEEKPEEEPEEEEYTGPRNPFTGLPTEVDFASRRPYAVMINNIKKATPQCGISKADMIYEVPAEGGITRMIAIYQDLSVADVIGSVRSARPYFVDIAQGHDAIYIHAGGSEDAYSVMRSRGIPHIDGVNGTGETFFRDSWRRSNMGYEHSLMLDTTLVPGFVEKNGFRQEYEEGRSVNMTFADEVSLDGQTAENITVQVTTSKETLFEFDKETELYRVSEYGSAYTDSADGAQVAVKNLIVIETGVYRISGDTAGRLRIELTGSGSGYFACNGKCVPITWSKESAGSQFEYRFEDGTPIEFGRGVTYVCITTKGNVSYS